MKRFDVMVAGAGPAVVDRGEVERDGEDDAGDAVPEHQLAAPDPVRFFCTVS